MSTARVSARSSGIRSPGPSYSLAEVAQLLDAERVEGLHHRDVGLPDRVRGGQPTDPVVPVHHVRPPVAPAHRSASQRPNSGTCGTSSAVGVRGRRADRDPLHPVAVDVGRIRRTRVVAALVDPDVMAPSGQFGGDPRDVLVGAGRGAVGRPRRAGVRADKADAHRYLHRSDGR